MFVVSVPSIYQHISLSPLWKIRLYNLKRQIKEIHTSSYDVAAIHGWMNSPLPHHAGVNLTPP